MKTSSAKAKGRVLQNWIRDQLISALSLTSDDVFSRSMGVSGTDIYFSPAGLKAFPFAIEAKNVEKLNVWEAYNQAVQNSKPGLTPLLFIKKNRTIPLVVVDAEYFIGLFKPQ